MISQKAFEVLRKTTLFAGFTEEQLHMVPKVGRTRQFKAGEHIVKIGEEVNPGLWLVLEGSVRVEVEGEVLHTIGAGGHFGEMALLTGEPRSADVLADTDLVAMELSERHLKALIGRDPDVALAMLAELARRLRALTEDFARVVQRSPEAAAIVGELDRSMGDEQILGPIEYAIRSESSGA